LGGGGIFPPKYKKSEWMKNELMPLGLQNSGWEK
jgi:hypothetical protein